MCFVCEHDRRSEIDQALRAGTGPVALKRRLQITASLAEIVYHRDLCVLDVPDMGRVARAYRRAQQIEFFANGDLDSIHDRDLSVDPAGTIDDEGARRMGCAAVIMAIKDAQRGDDEALGWINGDDSRQFVAWLNLDLEDHWPPTSAQIGAAKVTRSGMG